MEYSNFECILIVKNFLPIIVERSSYLIKIIFHYRRFSFVFVRSTHVNFTLEIGKSLNKYVFNFFLLKIWKRVLARYFVKCDVIRKI